MEGASSAVTLRLIPSDDWCRKEGLSLFQTGLVSGGQVKEQNPPSFVFLPSSFLHLPHFSSYLPLTPQPSQLHLWEYMGAHAIIMRSLLTFAF